MSPHFSLSIRRIKKPAMKQVMLQSQISDAQGKNCSLAEPLHYRDMLFVQTNDKHMTIKKGFIYSYSRKP